MSEFWSHLFDSEWMQRRDIQATRYAVDRTKIDLASLERELVAARTRIDRLELALEGLVTLLETRGDLDRAELARFVTLADPAERSGAGATELAHPVHCVGCGRAFEETLLFADPDGPTCVGCHLSG